MNDGDESEKDAVDQRPAEEAGEAEPGDEFAQIPRAELEELRSRASERDEFLDKLKWVQAELANYRKRVEQDRGRWAEAGKRELLCRLLLTADQCRLAAAASGEDQSPESLRQALCMVWSEVERFLEEAGVTRIPVDCEFDPEIHQAVQVETRPDAQEASILAEARPGYRLGEDVLRPSQVVVAKRPREEGREQPKEADRTAEDASGGGGSAGQGR